MVSSLEHREPESPSRRVAVYVALIAAVAFGLRVFVGWPSVFGQEYVAFAETDAWYHMRLVDALVKGFPWRIWHDPYLLHPGGEPVNAGPMLDWIIAGSALVLGLGAPSPRLVDLVGAYVPPVLGALTILPVYVLGRELFSRTTGLWAASLAAVMPGQLFLRSMLGFTDHHCAEVLLSTTAFMFLVLAVNARQDRSRRFSMAIAGGVALGAYLLTWSGGVLVVAILLVWAWSRQLASSGRSDEAVEVVLPVLSIASVMVAPWAGVRPYFTYQLVVLAGGAAAIVAFHLGHRLVRRRAWRRSAVMASAAGAVVVALIVAFMALSDSAASLISDLSRVSPFRSRGFTAEAQPLMASDLWRPFPLWREFTFGVALSLFGAGALVWAVATKRRSSQLMLLGLWTVTMLVATFGQVRFTYYLAVNVALLGGIACDVILNVLSKTRAHAAIRAIAPCVLAALVVIPSLQILMPLRNAGPSVNPSWFDALLWLRTNTPEPFSDAAAYDASRPSGSETSAYGVLALWDYGYWITRIAHRVPISNPRQTGVREVTAFLLSSNESDATQVMERSGARYVAVDWVLQGPNTATKFPKGFPFLVVAAGGNIETYCGLFSEEPSSGGRRQDPVVYCYPEYYRTMAMRLYLYGGKAVTPSEPVFVVSFRREVRNRTAVNVVTGQWRFDTYEEASHFVVSSGRPDVRIVSKDPRRTCVPLEALGNYVPVFRSFEREWAGSAAPPLVQLFEYRPRRPSRGEP